VPGRYTSAPLKGVTKYESGEAYSHPGSVAYYFDPDLQEIAICHGAGRFRGHTGPLLVTPIAEIEGDFVGSDWVKAARKLPETPFRYPTHKGPKIEVEFDEAKVTATLLEDTAPKTVAAFQKLLPLEGRAWNDHLAGERTKFWALTGRKARSRSRSPSRRTVSTCCGRATCTTTPRSADSGSPGAKPR
jgi:hypothetical protein